MGLRNLFVGGFELVLQLCKRLCCAHSLAKFYLTDAEPRGALRDVVGFEELSIGKNTLDGVLFLSIVKEFHSFFWGGGGCGDCVLCWSLAKLQTTLMWGFMWLSVGWVWEFFFEVHGRQ